MEAELSVVTAVLNGAAEAIGEAVPEQPVPGENPASVVEIVVGDTLEMVRWKLVRAAIQAKPKRTLIKVAIELGVGVRTLGMWRRSWQSVTPSPASNTPSLNKPAVEIRVGDTVARAEEMLIRKTIEANPGETFKTLAQVLGMGIRTLGIKRTEFGMPNYPRKMAAAAA